MASVPVKRISPVGRIPIIGRVVRCCVDFDQAATRGARMPWRHCCTANMSVHFQGLRRLAPVPKRMDHMAAQQPAETLHSRILDAFRSKIVDGIWPAGHQLPKETELAEQHGVSRMTMNKVLTQLAQEGFVVRRKRSGTFVAQARVQSAIMEISNIAEEVAALGRPHRWQLLTRERRHLHPADLRLLGVQRPAVDDEVLFLQGVHYAGDQPFCLETRAINLTAVPDAADQDFAVEPAGKWLLRLMPWTSARHQVRAVNIAGREAKLLSLPVGAACMDILRKTGIEGTWVTYARLLYPGEAHQLVAEFEPRAAALSNAPTGAARS